MTEKIFGEKIWNICTELHMNLGTQEKISNYPEQITSSVNTSYTTFNYFSWCENVVEIIHEGTSMFFSLYFRRGKNKFFLSYGIRTKEENFKSICLNESFRKSDDLEEFLFEIISSTFIK